MKSKTSLFKKGLIVSDIKRFWWISVLYALGLLFSMPLNHYMQKFNIQNNNDDWIKDLIVDSLNFRNGVGQAFLVVAPFIIGTLVFRYMQKRRSASLYYSIPLTRTALYINSVLSALVLFLAPVLLTTLVMLLLLCFSFLSTIYSVTLIFTWVLYTLMFGIMFIAMAVFVGMFTGSSIAQIIFVYILNFLFVFFVEFSKIHLSELLFGFETYSNSNIYNNLPIIALFNIYSSNFTSTLIIVFIALTIALFIGGLYAFKLRKPETAGDIITFKPIRPVFIYGVTACATLLGGAYFMVISKSSFAFIVFGYLISSLVSYVAVQMITNKSFKILHTYKGYLGFALVLILLVTGIKFDFIGYVNKTPAADEVVEAYIGYDINWWQNKDNPNINFKYHEQNNFVYKDKDNFDKIINLHKSILDKKNKDGESKFIAYKLKNGKNLIRKYNINSNLYSSELAPIYESKEYKQNRYPILYQDTNAIKYIEISDRRTGKTPFVISDKAKLKEFKSAISKDIQELKYTELVRNYDENVVINIADLKSDYITYAIHSFYTNTINWLKKEGIYDQVVLAAKDINSITLENYSYVKHNDPDNRNSNLPKSVTITDSEVIDELLALTRDIYYDYNGYSKTINYSMNIDTKNNNNTYGFSLFLDEATKLSPKLQSYINKIK